MATVTSFESLSHPSRSELRQFAELFAPLYCASTDDARRQAVAALSQSDNVPPAVALFVASQPIAIAAPFLVSSQCLDDQTLITIARTQGAAHARAIVRRENLSPTVIDALVGLRHSRPDYDEPQNRQPAPADPAPQPRQAGDVAMAEIARLAREEVLRRQLRQMAGQPAQQDNRTTASRLTDIQEALLVRFARERETGHFATTLADSMGSTRWLAERIMLDISGMQLATTLMALEAGSSESAFVLTQIYPHLQESDGKTNRARAMLATLDAVACKERLNAWRRADSYTFNTQTRQPEDTARAATPPQDQQPQARIRYR